MGYLWKYIRTRATNFALGFDEKWLSVYDATNTKPLYSNRYQRQELALELFSAIRKQHIQVQINEMFELNEASKAHTLLQSRKTVGSTVLLP